MKSPKDIALMREEYAHDRLDKSDLGTDPFQQFGLWFDEAVNAALYLPNTAVLATAFEGQPSARMVLLKDYDEQGFVFYTNYESRKGKELSVNPKAGLTFYWQEFSRQVRIEGIVERTSAEEADAYFETRPLPSQIGAWASPQSEVIENREVLDMEVQAITSKFAGIEKVPRPDFWGGYRLKPHMVEFWQGRVSRLHDRFSYSPADDGTWNLVRLAP